MEFYFSITHPKKKVWKFILFSSDVNYLSDVNYSCPSPITNTSRSFFKRQEGARDAFEALFLKDEAHYPMVAFFDELM